MYFLMYDYELFQRNVVDAFLERTSNIMTYNLRNKLLENNNKNILIVFNFTQIKHVKD